MNTTDILKQLRQELERIQKAISALENLDGATSHRGKKPGTATAFPFGATKPRKRRRMSKAARMKIAAAQKARWAKAKASKK